MKTYTSTHFLTLVLDGAEWSASRTGRFILGDNRQYLLYRLLGESQSRTRRGGEEEKLHVKKRIKIELPIVIRYLIVLFFKSILSKISKFMKVFSNIFSENSGGSRTINCN